MSNHYSTPLRGWLQTTLLRPLLIVGLVLMACQAQATHYRYGNMTYQILTNDTVEITIQQAWRRTFFFGPPNVGSVVNTGYLTVVGYPGSSIQLEVTAVNVAEDWFFGVFKRKIHMPGATNVLAYWHSGDRISTLQNNADANYRNEIYITTTNGNSGPQATLPPIVNLQVGQTPASFMVPAVDPDGDPLWYRLSTSSETAVSNLAGFAVDSATGMATYNTVGKTVGHLYTAQVTVLDTAGAKSVVDFIIRIVAQSNPPQWDYTVTPANGFTYNVNPGTPINFMVKAFDLDSADNVVISAVGLPAGATHNPVLPTAGANPDSSSFSWTPTNADIGAYVINYTAEDNGGAQTNTSVNILVNTAPNFDVPPTPAQGAHLIYKCGDTIQWTAQASDLDPGDSVQIISATGKNFTTNAVIPLYPGASFSPLPTPLANPTSGNFYWIPAPSDWGHKHVILTAEDESGNQKKHEVSQLINTPPEITSTGDTCVYVDSVYYYKVVVADKDTAYGDSLDLFAANLPPWLTFTDLGNGCGELTGTPGPLDVGVANVMITAQDVHHHMGGEDIQFLDIEVKQPGGVVDTSDCDTDTILCVTDASWMQSTYTEAGPFSGPWPGASTLPANGTYTNPVTLGQPYSYHSIDSLPEARVIKAPNNVTFYRKEMILSGNQGVSLRLQSRTDDGLEVYVNGVLLLREDDIDSSNWKSKPHEVLFDASGVTTNGASGNQSYDMVTTLDLDTVLQVGANEIVVALFNLTGPQDRGGMTMRIEAEVPCPAVDSCVSDSTWDLSTVITQSNWGGDWTGVGGVLPHDSTYTLKAEEGQPYVWGGIPAVVGSQPIKATNKIRYYRKCFNVVDKDDVDARIRMYMDDGMELYLNGVLLCAEYNSHSSNWNGVSHDVLFNADATINNGNGNQVYDYVAPVDLDTILKDTKNTMILALYNYRGAKNKGGFSFRMDMTKNGNPNIIPIKAGVSLSADDRRLAVYPNPSGGQINILIETTSRSDRQLEVMDLSGRVVHSAVINGRMNHFTADLSHFTPGMYLVRVVVDNEVFTQKLFKY